MAWGWRGRGGGWAGPYPGRGPFSYLPPWQRPGWLFSFGRGLCRWLWSYPYNPWACARFPWLPRWWWAYPQYGCILPYMTYGWSYWYPFNTYAMPGYAYHPRAYPYAYPPAPYIVYW